MDRERILAASRAENRRGDERARHIDYESFTVGAILMAAMFAVLYFVRRVLRGEEAYDLLALFFTLYAGRYATLAFYERRRRYILTALLGGAAALAGLALFFLKG